MKLSRKQKAAIRHTLWYNTSAQIDDTELVLPAGAEEGGLLHEAAQAYANAANDSRYSTRDQKGPPND